MAEDDPHSRHTRHFVPDAAIGWPFAIAALERINKWTVSALRMGTLMLLQQTVRAMAMPGAKRELTARAKEILNALDHLPWEG